ncbi:uncharacterized protein LOC119261826 isoform X2 [Pygocentrus nattereri]|uniref:uncharacterized protein LOC119261826 isoform X2 n=1 Tax=Pygocentrus nattereri TaxID=42514 RepID=UPI001891519C|nr:uncharacterized protein LOC119261826 isoform X2 [Pygocentrus nattereri]
MPGRGMMRRRWAWLSNCILREAETVQITVADEVAAEVINSTMSICLEGSEEKPLVSSNPDTGKVIRELLDILFDDALSASLHLLENELMDTNLDHLVSCNKDAADAIRELLEIMLHDVLSASFQPLEDDQVLKMSDSEANDEQTHPDLEKSEPTNIHPLAFLRITAGDEWPKLKDHVAEEHLDLTEASDSDDQPLDIKKSHPPEEEDTNKRKTRRGTRGKGRKIVYNKEKHPNDKLDGQRGSRGSSGQTNNVKNCGHENREMVRPKRVQLE